MRTYPRAMGQRGRWVCLAAAALMATAAAARAETQQELIKRVNPSVVEIRNTEERGHSLGSGFVVDAKMGLIFTNFHVVNDAKQITVVFTADKDGKEYPTEGFLEVLPEKDLCLLKMVPGAKKLQQLKVADKLPVQGEPVYTFGSSITLSGTVAHGMVTSIRNGLEIRTIFDQFNGKGCFKSTLHYDNDCVWIQHDAPMSHGNSGGALVNKKGEVLGLNTWCFDPSGQGQQLNFAISAKHIKELLLRAGSAPKPWSALPKGKGPGHGEFSGGGNPEKTLAAWKTLNRGMFEFNHRLDNADRRLEAIPKPNPQFPMKGRQTRIKKLQTVMKAYGTAYCDFATKIRQIDLKQVHHQLAGWLMTEATVLDKAGKSYKEIASSISAENSAAEQYAEAKAEYYKDFIEQLHDMYDKMRLQLGECFEQEYPTVEQTATEDTNNPGADKPGTQPGHGPAEGDIGSWGGDSGFRIWTSNDGNYQVNAKYLGVTDDGKRVPAREKERRQGDRRAVDRALQGGSAAHRPAHRQTGKRLGRRTPPTRNHGNAPPEKSSGGFFYAFLDLESHLDHLRRVGVAGPCRASRAGRRPGDAPPRWKDHRARRARLGHRPRRRSGAVGARRRNVAGPARSTGEAHPR